jgi:short-subunit dehydrogenase
MKDRVVVIFGVGSGIGKAISILFAKNLAKVYFVARSKSFGDRLEKELKDINPSIFYLEGDAANFEDVENIRKNVLKKEGRVDFLIINTGKWLTK